MTQLRYFFADYMRMVGKTKLRIFIVWATAGGVGIFFYRFERSMYLIFGKSWSFFRLLILPLLLLAEAYSKCDINYKADIGPGLKILHTVSGITISGLAVIGKNITLSGGNTIGGRRLNDKLPYIIGDNVYLGVNAIIIGPVILGNNVSVAAGSVVMKDAPDNCTLIGVPARDILIHLRDYWEEE